jgi:hypothetical protein
LVNTVEPFSGEVMVEVGGVRSVLEITVMVTVATFESAFPSLARYVKVSEPEKSGAGT